MADDPRDGATKPIAYAPVVEPSASREGPASARDDLPPLVSSSGGTKPVAFAPERHDADVEAQGYLVRGFSSSAPDSVDVPRVVLEDPNAARARFGDRAGEDKWMPRREGVSAWPHVLVGFVLLDALVATATTWAIAEAAWRAGVGASTTRDAVAIAAGATLGLVIAFGAFRDRWRCTEAFASRYVRGWPSHVWVPWIAGGYGVWRGLRKLRGK